MKHVFTALAIVLLFAETASSATLASFDGSAWPKARATVKIDKDIRNPKFSLDIFDKRFDGVVSKIEDLGNPINVVFVVDISQSVGYNLVELKPILASIAGCFSANDTFSMITFSDKAETLLKFSSNPAEIAHQMGKLVANKMDSHIFNAVNEASLLLAAKPDAKGLIFLFSDGEDTSGAKNDKLPDCPVITIAPPANVITSVLLSIGKKTGGLSLFSANFDIGEVKEFVDLYKDWKNATYSIDFNNLPDIGSGRFDLKLIVDDGQNDLVVPVSVEIEGRPSLAWVWVLLGLAVTVSVGIWLWSMRKTSVPKGKTVVEKPAEDMHYLAWISLADDDERQFRIRKNKVLIGTDPNADFYVDDPTVSVCHANIIEKADGYYVSDCESVSGTFINNKRLQEPQKLMDGDIIRVGETDLKFTQSDFAYVSKKKVI